ncbi:MAG: hypothetical protein ACXVAR_18775, partial [Vulcanimicrobiaceae bacterium]
TPAVRARSLSDAVAGSDESLATAVSIVNLLGDMRKKYNEGQRSEYYADPLISEAQLEELKGEVIAKIDQWVKDGRLLDPGNLHLHRDTILVLACWRSWAGSEHARNLLESQLTLESFAALITKFTTPGHRSQTSADLGVLFDILTKADLEKRASEIPQSKLDSDATLAEGVSVLKSMVTAMDHGVTVATADLVLPKQ